MCCDKFFQTKVDSKYMNGWSNKQTYTAFQILSKSFSDQCKEILHSLTESLLDEYEDNTDEYKNSLKELMVDEIRQLFDESMKDVKWDEIADHMIMFKV